MEGVLTSGDAREIAGIVSEVSDIVKDVLIEGAINGKDSFRTQPPEFHIARAETHLRKLRLGDTSEPHLEHAATRLAMAAVLERRREEADANPRDFMAGGRGK